jgi:lysozyme family protein
MSFSSVIKMILEHEGGYVNHPSDPGGETKYGISKRAYPDIDIANLTEEDAEEIYYRDYWSKIKGDDLACLLLLVLSWTTLLTQESLVRPVQSNTPVESQKGDGIIGPHTLQRCMGYCTKIPGRRVIVNEVTRLRQEFIRGLSIYDTFGKGWERRIDETRAKAMELI